jgi:hypothetical protein
MVAVEKVVFASLGPCWPPWSCCPSVGSRLFLRRAID